MTDNLTKRVKDALALDEKRTPGDWIADDFCEEDGEIRRIGTNDGTEAYYHNTATIAYCQTNTWQEADHDKQPIISEPKRKFNAQFIAAAPSFVQLIRELEAARLEALDRIERMERAFLRQLQEAQKDAERYRWLRDNCNLIAVQTLEMNSDEDLDAAIDAAIQTKEQGS